MIGDKDISAAAAKASTKTYGFTLGGPIIKNKLFFFANLEREQSTTPGIQFSPKGGSGIGQIAATPVADLQKVSEYLAQAPYNYITGRYDEFQAFKPENTKVLAKLDWNINDKNKLTVKYSYLYAKSDLTINATGVPGGNNFTFTNNLGAPATRNTLPNARYSLNSIAFENSNFGYLNKVSTGTAELNSTINPKLSNQLLLTFKNNGAPRTTKGTTFPTIDIFDGAGNNYITAGSDPNTKFNDVVDNTISLYDNITYYAGKHTITGGINYEFQKIGNAFMPGAAGSYIYNSLSDFLGDKPPIQFTYNYSLIPGEEKVFSANLKVGTLSLYAQDEFAVSDNFKITYGLRADKSLYLQDPVENPQITALQFPDADGNMTSYNTGKWPKSRILLSPRAGFRASLLEDKSLVLRGGLGVFTGRMPYIFLTNMPSNSAMYNFLGVATTAQLQNIKLNADPSVYADLFPQVAGTAVQSTTVLIDRNYQFPQVFRADLALEKNLGNGFTASLEAIYTKDINATRMRNANLKTPTGVINEGDFSRPRYIGSGTNGAVQAVDRAIYPNIGSAIVLENTDKGYSSALTAQLTKNFYNGFNASIAYTYTTSKEAFATAGTNAAGVWGATANVGTTNDVELSNSANYVPHRIVANASYKFDYSKHAATTIGIFYQGQAGSSPISYTINGDLNGDNNSGDLMYIPKKASEIRFAAIPATATVPGFTAEQQTAAFEQFIKNTPYLNAHRGQYAERNAAFLPWYNRIDANVQQEFYITTANGKKHTLQFNAVVINLPNLLSKYWGIQKLSVTNSPLTYSSIDANGVPTYTLRQFNGQLVTQPFQNVATANTTWSMMIGAKYIF